MRVNGEGLTSFINFTECLNYTRSIQCLFIDLIVSRETIACLLCFDVSRETYVTKQKPLSGLF
ncbi:hypothetical protein DTO96_100407 [Ephemeroptericola cinctiostellae]|uniref:Uncharacterized protein n=1 Tax=Ephemeroptericola cinctiostellae TaxID=2268024 RepID=A0A345D8K9_9BURK|nr:hypothetical protein DTO96_100407 [Ephemeroptericola cinctiostellae]